MQHTCCHPQFSQCCNVVVNETCWGDADAVPAMHSYFQSWNIKAESCPMIESLESNGTGGRYVLNWIPKKFCTLWYQERIGVPLVYLTAPTVMDLVAEGTGR